MGWLSDLWKYGPTARIRAQSREAERYVEEILAYEKSLRTLGPAEAKSSAGQVLATSQYLRVTKAEGASSEHVASLGRTYQEFFGQYGRVECSDGESYVDVAEIQLCPWATEYIRLGSNDEHTHVMARPDDDVVYVVADDVDAETMLESQFPTIFHWLLAMQRSDELLHDAKTES